MSDTLSMTLTDEAVLSEEDLLERARLGDRTAFGALYLRHREAARRVAGVCTSSAADAEDAVAEGFARVFAALPRMAGRTIAFRPYLLTCVRNAATDRIRRERRVDLRETMPETPTLHEADDVALRGLECNLVGEALQALPARWRTVLWLTEVEGLTPAEVSRQIGIKPNAVAALAYRARKGLREAYLQAHLSAEASEECRGTVARLGHYVRGELGGKDRLAVQEHLDACAKCRNRRDELTDVNATLRNAFLPVPLLLAGLSRRLPGFSQVAGALFDHLPDLAQAPPLTDPTLGHKAVAGLTVVALAIAGTGVVGREVRPRAPSPKAVAAAPAAAAPRMTTATVSGPAPHVLGLASGALAAGPLSAPATTPTTTSRDVRSPDPRSSTTLTLPGSGAASGSRSTPGAGSASVPATSSGSGSGLLFSGAGALPVIASAVPGAVLHHAVGVAVGVLTGTSLAGLLDPVLGSTGLATLPTGAAVLTPASSGASANPPGLAPASSPALRPTAPALLPLIGSPPAGALPLARGRNAPAPASSVPQAPIPPSATPPLSSALDGLLRSVGDTLRSLTGGR